MSKDVSSGGLGDESYAEPIERWEDVPADIRELIEIRLENYNEPHLGNNNVLNLQDCMVDDRVLKPVFDRIDREKIQPEELNLSANRIGDEGAKIIANMHYLCRRLMSLSLSKNNITAIGATFLVSSTALKELRYLSLEDNKIGPHGASDFGSRYTRLVNLRSLNLNGNEITDSGLAGLIRNTAANKRFTSLGLKRNLIGDKGASALAGRGPLFTNLVFLDLSENNISDRGLQYFAEKKSVFPMLEHLRLNSNKISNPQALLDIIRMHRPGGESKGRLRYLGWDSDSLREMENELRRHAEPSGMSEEAEKAMVKLMSLIEATDRVVVESDDVASESGTEEEMARAVMGYDLRLSHAKDATPDEAALDTPAYAHVLASLFATSDEQFCFGLLGHWGRGKTYLMECVQRLLEAPIGSSSGGESTSLSPRYCVVRFSAWAYPHAPTMWAHLYRTIASRLASQTNWRVRTAANLRAGIIRHGMRKLFWALIMLAVGLGGLYADAGHWIWTSFGVLGVFVLASLLSGGVQFSARVKHLVLKAANHDDKLGLQATIGEDLRALLMGWVRPRSVRQGIAQELRNWCSASWRRRKAKRNVQTSSQACFSSTEWTFYALGCVALAIGLGWRAYKIAGHESVSLLVGVLAILAVLVAVVGYLISYAMRHLWCDPPVERVLLYVDDLDRCHQSQMLEVMEGLMQFLESSNVHSRMQVVMLVDEAALAAAIINKYKSISDLGTGKLVPSTRQLVTENIEKLFIGYLRLAPLQDRDLESVAAKHFESRLAKNRYSAAPDDKSDDEPQVPTVTLREVRETDDSRRAETVLQDAQKLLTEETAMLPRAQDADAVHEIGDPISYSPEEEKVLVQRVKSLAVDRMTRPGPRTVRGLLFRYQLARDLTLALQNREPTSWMQEDCEHLIDAILRADRGEIAGSPDSYDVTAGLVSLCIGSGETTVEGGTGPKHE